MIPREVYTETLLEHLEPVRGFLDDPSVSEIMINGPAQIFVERRGKLELTSARFKSARAILSALRNVAQFVGKHVDEQNPILEARLPDGSRVQAVLPPAAPDGPFVTIRRFAKANFSVEHLIDLDTLPALAAETVRAMVHAKLNVMIAGGTGCGKTSLLNAFTRFIPQGERIVVIEDSQEVQVQHEHVVSLEARPADLQGNGAVSIRDLFRSTLRMRPDRIVIGEIRGGEALDIVQAMVSGHGGCLGTLHATYPRDTLTRLETMAMMSDIDMPLAALRLQIASGINVIVQAARLRDGSRKITHITEVSGFDMQTNRYELRDLFVRDYRGTDAHGRILSELRPSGALPSFLPQLHEHGVDLPAAVHEAARSKADSPA